MTFLDLDYTGTRQNDSNYTNPEYDELISNAKNELDE